MSKTDEALHYLWCLMKVGHSFSYALKKTSKDKNLNAAEIHKLKRKYFLC